MSWEKGDQFQEVLTLHPWRFTTSNWWQNLAKQMTALLVTCLHPLLIKLFNLGQPLDKASMPFSVILLHQLMLICVKFGQPSLKAFKELSVMAPQPSRFSFCNFEQCRDRAVQVESVSFLQAFKLRSSTFGHNWARVFIEPSAMDWQPRRDSCRRKPPQRRDMFSIIGPCNKKIKILNSWMDQMFLCTIVKVQRKKPFRHNNNINAL